MPHARARLRKYRAGGAARSSRTVTRTLMGYLVAKVMGPVEGLE